MKTFLLSIVLCISISVSGQNVVKNLTQWNLDSFIVTCLEDLKVDSCFIVIQPIKGLAYGKYDALTRNAGGVYTIQMSNYMNYTQTLLTIAHELVHVKQLSSGVLIVKDNGDVIFHGKTYKTNENTHYSDAQEIEARIMGTQLYEKYKPLLVY